MDKATLKAVQEMSKSLFEQSLDGVWHDYNSVETIADFESVMAEHHFKNGFRAGHKMGAVEISNFLDRMINIAHEVGTQEQGYKKFLKILAEYNDLYLTSKEQDK